jgi:hypothetical protein
VTSPRRQPFRLLCVAAAFLGFGAMAMAQGGAVRTEVDARRLGVDDTTTLSIVLEGDAASLDAALPALRNLRVVGGPSTSTQISFVNGSMSRQKVLSFILRPERPGPAEIGPLFVQGYPTTAAITLEAVPGSIRPAQTQDPFGRDPFGRGDPFEEIFGRPQRRPPPSEGKLFVEASLSRPAARVGEPILVTYFVYTQVSLSGVEFAEAPKYPGFWAEEIDRSKSDSSGANVSAQGEPFLRYPVLERLLFPTRTGVLEIPEARLRLVPGAGIFGVAAPVERRTKALKVKVDPLPVGAPENSAVGTYEVRAMTDRNEITLGDALTFRFRVQGRGNLKWIDAAPSLEIPGTRIFPPRVISDLKTTRQGVEGSKTWEFVIVPEKEGTFEIPPLSFPYFDLDGQALRTARTDPIKIAVSASSTSGPLSGTKGPATGVSLRADLDAAQGDLSKPALGLAIVSLLTHVYRSRRRIARSNSLWRDRGSIQAALRDVQDAALLDGTKERATLRMVGALETVFGPRAAWPSDDDGDRLRSLADDLDFLRFAPQLGSYETKLKEVRDRTIALIEGAR